MRKILLYYRTRTVEVINNIMNRSRRTHAISIAVAVALGLLLRPAVGYAYDDCAIDDDNFVIPGDVSGTSNTYSLTVTSRVVRVTTHGPNRLILFFPALIAEAPNSVGGPPIVTGVSGAGLVWTRRNRVAGSTVNCWYVDLSQTCYIDLEEWWAIAPVQLTNAPITVTADSGLAFANLLMTPLTIPDTANIFDPNVSLPVSVSHIQPRVSQGGVETYQTVSGVSTNLNNSRLIFGCASWTDVGGFPPLPGGFYCNELQSPGSGWHNANTNFWNQGNAFIAFGINNAFMMSDRRAPQTNVTIPTIGTSPVSSTWVAFGDALQCNSPASGRIPSIWISVTD